MQEKARKSDEALAVLAQAGETWAEEELLNRYKSAVRARARKFFLAGGETEDLVQEGMIGLISAIRTYKEGAGKRFKNFAYLCVTRRIYDALRAADKKAYEDLDPDCVPGRILHTTRPSMVCTDVSPPNTAVVYGMLTVV